MCLTRSTSCEHLVTRAVVGGRAFPILLYDIMRTLHLCSWFQPQLGYSEFHLPTALQRAGHTVAIVTSDRYYPFPDYDSTIRPLLGPRIVGVRRGVECGLYTYRLPVAFEYRHHLWLRGLDQVIAEFKPDVVHTYQTFTLPTFQSAWAQKKFNYRLIVRSTMEKEVFGDQPVGRRLFYALFSRFCAPIMRARVDRFTTVSEGSREITQRVMSLPQAKVDVVPLGADSHRFRFDEDARIEVRKKFGIGENKCVVLYAGKLIERKDVHILADAIARTNMPAVLMLIGRGAPTYEARLRDAIQGTARKIIIQPPVPNEQLSSFFSACDIAVWPSECSNAAIEAGMVGVPLIVSDSEGSRSYVAHNNGRLFPRGDARALASILDELGNNPELRKRLGENGRVHFTSTLSWDAIAAKTEITYRQMLQSRAMVANTKG